MCHQSEIYPSNQLALLWDIQFLQNNHRATLVLSPTMKMPIGPSWPEPSPHSPLFHAQLCFYSIIVNPTLICSQHHQYLQHRLNKKSPDMILPSMMAASFVRGVETWLLFVFCLSLSLSLSLLCCWMPIFDLNHLYSKLITLLPRLLVFVSVFSLVFVPIFTFICASVFVFVFSLDAHFWPQSPPTTKQSGRFQASLSLSLSLYLSLSLCPYLYYSLSSSVAGCPF